MALKLFLVALNARYSHSNPAVRYLSNACRHLKDWQCVFAEWSINRDAQSIAGEIIAAQPQIVGFSCYIWNIHHIREIAAILRQKAPELVQIWGGPEAGANGESCLDGGADYVLQGEGETSLPAFLLAWQRGADQKEMEQVPGLIWRQEGRLQSNPPAPFLDLSAQPFPYDAADLAALENRIVYYESSRGCPFCCHFCLSATEPPRYRALSLVYEDLSVFLSSNVRQVKFIDRTFNAQSRRTQEILTYLLNHYRPGINFHLEIEPSLLSNDILSLLAAMPMGFIQVEAGVQSTNPQVLSNVGRHFKRDIWERYLKQLIAEDNIHVHLDIIAGLPEEDYASVQRTFNDLYRLYPHYLQLGFLKVLPGTPLAETAKTWGLVWETDAPYVVTQSPWISEEAWQELKLVDHALNKLHNSGNFVRTVRRAVELWPGGAYDLYLALSKEGMGKIKHPSRLYLALWDFLERNLPGLGWQHWLRWDWYHRFGSEPMPQALAYGEESADLLKLYQDEILWLRPDMADVPRHKWHNTLLAVAFPQAEKKGPEMTEIIEQTEETEERHKTEMKAINIDERNMRDARGERRMPEEGASQENRESKENRKADQIFLLQLDRPQSIRQSFAMIPLTPLETQV